MSVEVLVAAPYVAGALGVSGAAVVASGRRELAALPPDAGIEDHFAVLSRAPLRVEGNGDIRRERTVAAVVLRPGLGELHVRPGDPARSRTRSFRLHPAEVTSA